MYLMQTKCFQQTEGDFHLFRRTCPVCNNTVTEGVEFSHSLMRNSIVYHDKCVHLLADSYRDHAGSYRADLVNELIFCEDDETDKQETLEDIVARLYGEDKREFLHSLSDLVGSKFLDVELAKVLTWKETSDPAVRAAIWTMLGPMEVGDWKVPLMEVLKHRTIESIHAANPDLFAAAKEWIGEGWGLKDNPEPAQIAAALLMEAETQDACVKSGESHPDYPKRLRTVARQIIDVLCEG